MQNPPLRYYASIFAHYQPVDRDVWNFSIDVSGCIICYYILLYTITYYYILFYAAYRSVKVYYIGDSVIVWYVEYMF
jgi:hypothetical protein